MFDAPGNLGKRLSQDRATQVELHVIGDRDRILAVVEKVRGVESVTVNPTEDGSWEVLVTGRRKDLQDALAKAVVKGGQGLRQLQSRQLSLEDIFLELTASEEVPVG